VYIRPFLLLPVGLPVLEELVVHGPIKSSNDADHSIQFKTLKNLSLIWTWPPLCLLSKVLPMTPSLVNLRTSIHGSLPLNGGSRFPTHLQHIFIHPPSDPKRVTDSPSIYYDNTMSTLRRLTDSDHRVTLLLPLQLDGNMFPILEAEAEWNVSAAGGTQTYMESTSRM